MDKFKSRGLVQSIMPSFRDDFESTETTGPVNKMQPMQQSQGGFKSGSNTPGLWDRAKNLFRPTTKYRSVTPGSGTVGGATNTPIDKLKGLFANKTGSVESGGAGGSTSYATYAQYAGVASVGLAFGDLAGSIYNKRKSKRKK